MAAICINIKTFKHYNETQAITSTLDDSAPVVKLKADILKATVRVTFAKCCNVAEGCQEIQNFNVSSKGQIHYLLGCKWCALHEILTKGLTVNSDRYCATLRLFKKLIRRIRPEMNVFVLHHDNARPHCSAQTPDVIRKLNFTMVQQTSYSLDLPPLDFWLFLPKLKEMWKGKRFLTEAEVHATVRKWMHSQTEAFYMDGMKKCIERLNKCVAVSGDYVEK
ncbi:mariner Mos1 transposase [Trichonephila clavipes]|nr:mariner Mos1 transposase [Trichonephila clavipes]